jgi:hypothetical protein
MPARRSLSRSRSPRARAAGAAPRRLGSPQCVRCTCRHRRPAGSPVRRRDRRGSRGNAASRGGAAARSQSAREGEVLAFRIGTPGSWQRAAATLRSVEQEITDPQENSGPVPLSTIERCRTAALPSSTMPARFAILLIGGQTMLPIEHRARLPRVGV